MAGRFRNNMIRFKKPTSDKVVRFENSGKDFSALYLAQEWLHEHGYRYGSSCVPSPYIAAQKGEYNLPLKVYNMDKDDKAMIDAVMYSCDYRNGFVEVWMLK